MITIYMTRHGQTYWNVEKRLQGQGNSELTEIGIEAAEKLADRLENTDLDYIISSPLKRTIKTSETIRKGREIPIVTCSDLMEINVGDFSGYTVEQMKIKYPGLIEKIIEDPYSYAYPNGENLVEFYERCARAINYIIKNYDGKTVLIVTHGGVLKCIQHYFRNEMIQKDWAEHVAENCCLSKYQISGNDINEIYINDTKHLNSVDAL